MSATPPQTPLRVGEIFRRNARVVPISFEELRQIIEKALSLFRICDEVRVSSQRDAGHFHRLISQKKVGQVKINLNFMALGHVKNRLHIFIKMGIETNHKSFFIKLRGRTHIAKEVH